MLLKAKEHALADLKYRAEQGEEQYGIPLCAFNGRNALVDAYEEALDAYVYSIQYVMEQGPDADMELVEATAYLVLVAADVLRISEEREPGLLEGRQPEPTPRQPPLWNPSDTLNIGKDSIHVSLFMTDPEES